MPARYQNGNGGVKLLVVEMVADTNERTDYVSDMVTTKIGRRRKLHLYIKEWMDERGLSDEVLGNRMGVDRATVWRWRTQQHRLNPEKIAALAEAMNLESEDFYRPPSRPSLDSLVANVPEELHKTALDIVRRLVGRG